MIVLKEESRARFESPDSKTLAKRIFISFSVKPCKRYLAIRVKVEPGAGIGGDLVGVNCIQGDVLAVPGVLALDHF